jgi:hypothetical protein
LAGVSSGFCSDDIDVPVNAVEVALPASEDTSTLLTGALSCTDAIGTLGLLGLET